MVPRRLDDEGRLRARSTAVASALRVVRTSAGAQVFGVADFASLRGPPMTPTSIVLLVYLIAAVAVVGLKFLVWLLLPAEEDRP